MPRTELSVLHLFENVALKNASKKKGKLVCVYVWYRSIFYIPKRKKRTLRVLHEWEFAWETNNDECCYCDTKAE